MEKLLLKNIRGKEEKEPEKEWLDKIKNLSDKFFKKFPELKTEDFALKLSGPFIDGTSWILPGGKQDPDWLKIKDSQEFIDLDNALDEYYNYDNSNN